MHTEISSKEISLLVFMEEKERTGKNHSKENKKLKK